MNRSKLTVAAIFSAMLLISGCGQVKEEYWPNGNKKHEIHYKKGKMDGIAKWWYENGRLQQQVEYQEGKLNGLSILFYEHGVRAVQQKYKDGYKNGMTVEWDRSEKKILEENYKNDTLNGVSRRYYPTGTTRSEGYYNMGMYTGTWFYWNEIANVVGEGIFEDGTGILKEWNSRGDLIRQSQYRNNVKNGIETVWDENGNKVNEIIYKNGEIYQEADK